MKETKLIVVPIDFLESTGILIEYATYVAQKLSAKPIFLHVLDLGMFTYFTNDIMYSSFTEEIRESLLNKLKEKMSKIVEENCAQGVMCEGDVIVGEPVTDIVKFALKKNADLIIISTHGAKGWEKILLGSVTRRVVKRAQCPVWIINPFKNVPSLTDVKPR